MSYKIEVKNEKNPFDLENLRKLIDTKTREEIAQSLGCDTSLITKHYNNQRVVQVEYLIKYAAYFNVSVDYLLGRTTYKSALDTDKGELVRSIGDYTGLSEEAIEMLHNFNKPIKILEKKAEQEGFYKERERFNITRQIKFSPVNALLTSDEFYIAVDLLYRVEKGIDGFYFSALDCFDKASNDKYTVDELIAKLEEVYVFYSCDYELNYYKTKECLEESIRGMFTPYKERIKKIEDFFNYLFDEAKIADNSTLELILSKINTKKNISDIIVDEKTKEKLTLLAEKCIPVIDDMNNLISHLRGDN